MCDHTLLLKTQIVQDIRRYSQLVSFQFNGEEAKSLYVCVCVFVLRFCGSVNQIRSCRAWSVYLTTRLLGRLSPLSG